MKQILRLDWPKTKEGYEILEIDRKKVDWDVAPPGYDVTPPARASDDERRLLERWGLRLKPYEGEPDWQTARVIEPVSETSRTSNVMATSPELFAEFANTAGAEDKLLEFINQHGLPWTNRPVTVSECFHHAETMKQALIDWGKYGTSDPSRWLNKYQQHLPTGIQGEGQLHIAPTVEGGELQLELRPNDLISAMWLQLFLRTGSGLSISECGMCGDLIAVAASLSRTDKQFCSGACKQRNYRKRQKARAKQGGSAGRTTFRTRKRKSSR